MSAPLTTAAVFARTTHEDDPLKSCDLRVGEICFCAGSVGPARATILSPGQAGHSPQLAAGSVRLPGVVCNVLVLGLVFLVPAKCWFLVTPGQQLV